MANKKISDYADAALPLAGDEMLEIETVGGQSRKVSAQQVADLGSGGTPGHQNPVVQAVVSSPIVTPTFLDDLVKITAQTTALMLANPSGTAVEGWGIVIRIKDDGTARAISYDTQYRAIGVTLPTTTVVGKTLYLAGIWNVDDTTLDILAVGQQA